MIGDEIQRLWEAKIGGQIKCKSCIDYLDSLNTRDEIDSVELITGLDANLPFPLPIRTRLNTEARRQLIAATIASVVDIPVAATPQKRKTNRDERKRQHTHIYTSWRSEADGPVFPMGPFESKVRHLSYFVYPKTEDSWKWNLGELTKRFWLFNGRKVIGIVHDDDSAKPDDVLQYAASIGMTFDHVIIAANNPSQREVVLWVPMLECLKPETANADEVVFSAHAKGQKYDDPKHTRDWTDLMYRSCLDDWPSVYNALRSALMAGSFRQYGLFNRWYDWAYSGTFFWWRLAEIGKRNCREVDTWFCGTESWPGKMCDPRETACLFLNDSQDMYQADYWTKTVWPEWAKYQEALRAR